MDQGITLLGAVGDAAIRNFGELVQRVLRHFATLPEAAVELLFPNTGLFREFCRLRYYESWSRGELTAEIVDEFRLGLPIQAPVVPERNAEEIFHGERLGVHDADIVPPNVGEPGPEVDNVPIREVGFDIVESDVSEDGRDYGGLLVGGFEAQPEVENVDDNVNQSGI